MREIGSRCGRRLRNQAGSGHAWNGVGFQYMRLPLAVSSHIKTDYAAAFTYLERLNRNGLHLISELVGNGSRAEIVGSALCILGMEIISTGMRADLNDRKCLSFKYRNGKFFAIQECFHQAARFYMECSFQCRNQVFRLADNFNTDG